MIEKLNNKVQVIIGVFTLTSMICTGVVAAGSVYFAKAEDLNTLETIVYLDQIQDTEEDILILEEKIAKIESIDSNDLTPEDRRELSLCKSKLKRKIETLNYLQSLQK